MRPCLSGGTHWVPDIIISRGIFHKKPDRLFLSFDFFVQNDLQTLFVEITAFS
jgi:hypothetical protein